MKLFKSTFIIALMLLIAFNATPSTVAQNSQDPVMVDGTYNIYVEMDQWNMTVYDLNYMNQLIESGFNETEAKEQAKYDSRRIGSFQKDTTVNLTAVSLDVQHGISIDEVDVAIALNRPEPGAERGSPTIIEFITPDQDVSMTAYCHIFCGIGHENESHMMEFVVGDPFTNPLGMDTASFSLISIFLAISIYMVRRILNKKDIHSK